MGREGKGSEMGMEGIGKWGRLKGGEDRRRKGEKKGKGRGKGREREGKGKV